MKPFKFLCQFDIGLLQKYNLTNLLFGISNIVKVDIFTGNTSVETIKFFLLMNGFGFIDLPVSQWPGHRGGLAASKDYQLLNQLKQVVACDDQKTIKKIFSEQLILSQKVIPLEIERLKEFAFPLYLEFMEHKLIVN